MKTITILLILTLLLAWPLKLWLTREITKTLTEPLKVSYTASRDKLDRDDLVWRIYGLESSYGRNDGCKQQGKFNGFGYRQNRFEHKCYETFQAVDQEVHKWVKEKQKKGYSTAEILCLYNEGRVKKDCKYYQNYLAIR